MSENESQQRTVPSTAPRVDPGWAWTPYQPSTRCPWTLALAGHLFRRAAFGANWQKLQEALADGPQQTVTRLLQPEADVDAFQRQYDDFELSVTSSQSAVGLRAWWLRRMLSSPHPLLERMTLFWHGHFAVSNARVRNARMMHQYTRLLRSHALGSFSRLLTAMVHDPAVLLGVDAAASRKARPNTNLARALLGPFALGHNRPAQRDLDEASRALSGVFVLRGELRFIAREHDDGPKEVLGRQGELTGDDVVRIVLEQPEAPRFLARKLYRWLISETDSPSDELLAPLADSLAKDYEIGPLVETMLRSNLFFSPASYRKRVRSPLDYASGILHALEVTDVSTTELGQDLAAVGQDLCHPPTLQGWAGGRHWLSFATLLGRSNLAFALLGPGPYGARCDPWAVAQRHGFRSPDAAAGFLVDLFLQGDVDPKVRESLLSTAPSSAAGPSADTSRSLRGLTHAIVTLPEFQLS